MVGTDWKRTDVDSQIGREPMLKTRHTDLRRQADKKTYIYKETSRRRDTQTMRQTDNMTYRHKRRADTRHAGMRQAETKTMRGR